MDRITHLYIKDQTTLSYCEPFFFPSTILESGGGDTPSFFEYFIHFKSDFCRAFRLMLFIIQENFLSKTKMTQI